MPTKTIPDLTGQAISSENQWLWGNQGINYFNVNNKFHHTWHARSLSDNRAVAFYTDYGTTIDENTLNALAVNNLGEYVWPSQTVSISSVPSSIIHPACSGFAFHQFVLAWEDDRSGQTDIYAQNLSEFGTLGVVNATNQELLFNATYIYSNPANGKQVHFNTGDFDRIAIYDNSGRLIKTIASPPNQPFNLHFDDPGIYHVIFRSETKQIARKLVITR